MLAAAIARRLPAFNVLTTLLLLAGAAGAADPVPVEVAPAQVTDSAETLRLTGTVTAETSAGLSPRISGLVSQVHVDAGDRVDQGDVLLDLDRTLAELALRRAEASLQEARTQLDEAKRLQREASQLVKDRHIAETEAHSRDAAVKLQTAVVARLQAEVREAQERVDRHALIAPFDGVISRKMTEAGEWVETGTPVLELVSIERLRLDVRAPQERFRDISTDTPVTVRLYGSSDGGLNGRVSAKVPVNDPTARTFLVRVLVEHAKAAMIPGMSAEAVFSLTSDGPTVQVPRDALTRSEEGGDRVWTVNSEDGVTRAFPQDIRVGRTLGETVEILSGLAADQVVVIRGNEALRSGQAVRIVGRN